MFIFINFFKRHIMVRFFKIQIRNYKNKKRLEKDKRDLYPKHFPLVMSNQEKQYFQNALKLTGGGG